MMGGFTLRGEVVEPRAVGATATLLVFFLRESVVLGVVAGPGNGASRPSSQTQSPMLVVGAHLSVVGSVSPCQLPSLIVFIYQLQEAFSSVCSYQALAHCFGMPDVCQLIHAELRSPLLGVGFEGLYFLEAEGELVSV
jgi:hypothetical protein